MGIKSDKKKKSREKVQILLNISNNYSDDGMFANPAATKVLEDFDSKVREMECSLKRS